MLFLFFFSGVFLGTPRHQDEGDETVVCSLHQTLLYIFKDLISEAKLVCEFCVYLRKINFLRAVVLDLLLPFTLKHVRSSQIFCKSSSQYKPKNKGGVEIV